MPMIFCVEDDRAIRDLMIYALHSAGLEARGMDGGSALFSALQQEMPELIMLDIMLPGEDGITLLKKLRQNPATSDIPVIMATAKGTEYDKVLGLDLGADDYLTKPFGMMEMVSRVKAVLRRTIAKNSAQVLRMGNLEMNRSNHIVTVSGKRLELTLKEYEMLRLFLENPGRVYTRDQIFSIVWSADCIVESRTVDVHIGTLRSKLGECGSYIETVRGVGYRMEVRL